VVLLLSGRVKVSSFAEDGHETILGFRGAGDVLGELAAIDGEDSPATVTVVEAGDALVVPAERFLAALEEQPGLARGAQGRHVPVRGPRGPSPTSEAPSSDIHLPRLPARPWSPATDQVHQTRWTVAYRPDGW
jgi:hypothetical protein